MILFFAYTPSDIILHCSLSIFFYLFILLLNLALHWIVDTKLCLEGN